ncbi:MAG: DUF1963 domain-containing protein [Pirellulales bacterium]
MDPGLKSLYANLSQRLAADADLARLNLSAKARPSVRLSAHRAPSALIGIGESRIGGAPDVPRGFEWPRWIPSKPRDDVYAKPWRPDGPAPLGFIAQIDLSDIPQVDDNLPNSGWLYFFYDRHCEPWGFDPTDRGSCRIIYVDPDRSELSRADDLLLKS